MKGRKSNKRKGVTTALNFQCICTQCEPKCSFKGWATWSTSGSDRHLLIIKQRGDHNVEREPEGGQLWNGAEWKVLSKYIRGRNKICTREIRKLFREHGLRFRCADEQLWSFVARFNTEHRSAPVQGKVPVEVVKGHVADWSAKQKAMSEAAIDDLLVLKDVREPIVDEDRIYIPFTSRGMLERLRNAEGKYLKIVLDAKQNIVAQAWTILTIGFLACRQSPSRTSARKAAG